MPVALGRRERNESLLVAARGATLSPRPGSDAVNTASAVGNTTGGRWRTTGLDEVKS